MRAQLGLLEKIKAGGKKKQKKLGLYVPLRKINEFLPLLLALHPPVRSFGG